MKCYFGRARRIPFYFLKKTLKTSNKIPKEEENLDSLLDQMNRSSSQTSLSKQVQKENLLYLDPSASTLRLGDFLILEKKYLGQVISLREKHTILLLANNAVLESQKIQSYELIKGSNQFSYQSMKNKIIDSNGKAYESFEKNAETTTEFQNLLTTNNFSAKLTKIYKPRKQVEDALFTGTLVVDYGTPLYKGNFHLLSGNTKTGKKTFLRNVATNFFTNTKQSQRVPYLIYVTYSRSQATAIKKQCSSENITVFTLSEDASDAEYYYLPHVALNFANSLISSDSSSHLDILFCFDDISSFIFKEKTIFDNIQQPFAPKNLFAELYEKSGNFKGHTFTTFLINEQKANFEFEVDYQNYLNNIISYTDLVVKFDASIKFYKKYLPQISLNYNQSLHVYLHSKHVTKDLIRFREVMDEVNASHFRYEEALRLNVHKDPWENFMYYDSKFIIDFLMKKGYTPTVENDYISFKFLLFLLENDMVGHFTKEGKIANSRLFEHLCEKENEERYKKIMEFVKRLLVEKLEVEDQKFADFEAYLHEIFTEVVEKMKTREEFSLYKTDYFPI